MPEIQKTYLFIDGAYLKQTIAEIAGRLCIPAPNEINWEFPLGIFPTGPKIDRIMYYDAPPPQRNGEDASIYNQRLLDFDHEMKVICERDSFFVRTGFVRGRAGRARQKAVDIQIAVDMMNHSFRRNMQEAILLSGDLDFKPVVDALVSLGTHVTIWAEDRTASRDLFASADRRRRFSALDALRFFPEVSRKQYQPYGYGEIIDLSRPPLEEKPIALLSTVTLESGNILKVKKAASVFRIEIEFQRKRHPQSSIFSQAGYYWMHADLSYLLRYVAEDSKLVLPKLEDLGIPVTSPI